MKSFVISKRDAGTRVDRFIDKTFENLPKSLMFPEVYLSDNRENRIKKYEKRILRLIKSVVQMTKS